MLKASEAAKEDHAVAIDEEVHQRTKNHILRRTIVKLATFNVSKVRNCGTFPIYYFTVRIFQRLQRAQPLDLS